MTDSQCYLLSLLSKSLFNTIVECPEVDLKTVLDEAKYHAVVRVAYEGLDKNNCDIDDLKIWENAAYSNLANNLKIFQNHYILHQWMSENSIPYVILKGCSSAYYYPKAENRSMGDVDFLVPEDYVSLAGECLQKQDLKPWDETHIAHIVYRKHGMHYELHFNIAGIPDGYAGDLVREYMSDVFSQSQVVKCGSGELCFPSKFHHGLTILLHTCHHMTGEGIGLRHLCDWAVFVNSFSNNEFCDIFEDKLKSIGLWKFAKVLTQVSIKYLGIDSKTWAEGDYSVADVIMEDILAGGNFGSKDKQRSMQTLIISNRGKNGVGKNSMFVQAVKSANMIVYNKWPISKKVKVFLPFGWIFFGLRRVFREITGKRNKTKVNELIHKAADRRELYKYLHIFEVETQ